MTGPGRPGGAKGVLAVNGQATAGRQAAGVQGLPAAQELQSLLEDGLARGLRGRDCLSLRQFRREELERILVLAGLLKSLRRLGAEPALLRGRSVAMIFHKPSTRTRVSFEVGIHQLGGQALYLSAEELQLRRGESLYDTGQVLSRYVDGVVVRTYRQKDLEELADAATVPVVNALTDYSHPCQALADYFTVWEKLGRLQGVRLTYVGDANNVARSLAFGGALLGVHVRIASPPGYQLDEESIAWARGQAQLHGASLELWEDPGRAAEGADVLYTDVWVSMGQEAQAERRRQDLAPYQLNRALVERAAPHVLVMHCLPAHRGEEITDEVMDGPHSVVFDQAENRLHVQKALLALLIGARL